MSIKDKKIERLLKRPKDYTFAELKVLLNSLGYTENNKGKTSGSRVQFMKSNKPFPILLHRPHNPPYLKAYLIKQIIDYLKDSGDIYE